MVLVSLSASSPSARDTDPPLCLVMVSRRKPINDGLRRPLSGDSADAVGGHPPPLPLPPSLDVFDLFGDPVATDLAAAVAFELSDAAAVFASAGNLQNANYYRMGNLT